MSFLQRLEDNLREYAPLDQDAGPDDSTFSTRADRIDEQAARYREPFRLVIAGEFNAGKSSVINVLLGIRDFVLTGVTPTTGAITEIWYGQEELGAVLIDDQTIASGTRDEIAKYADQRTTEGRQIAGRGATIRLTSNAEVLRNLVIIDTPGLGANPKDDEITRDKLDLADAAIVVVSALQPGGETTKRLAEWLWRSHRRVLAVVTHMDVPDVTDPEDVLESVRVTLAESIEGQPVPVASPAILDALDLLAEADRESEKTDASSLLHKNGHTDLVQGLQDSLLFGDSAERRRLRVLSTAQRAITELLATAKKRMETLGDELLRIEEQLNDSQRTVQAVLRPKIPYLNRKIDEVVAAEISEYISDLSDAVEHFLDKINSQTLNTGFRYLRGLVTRRKERLGEELRKEFEVLFPPSQLDITLANIGRSVENLLQSEWEAASIEVQEMGEIEGFEPGRLAQQIAGQLATVAAATAAAAASAVMLLFVPGGQVLELGALLLSGLGIVKSRSRESSNKRLVLMKREARVSLRAQRRQFAHDVAEHFRSVNLEVGNGIIDEVRDAGGVHKNMHDELLDSLQEWQLASEDLRRWKASLESFGPGAPS